MKKLYNFYILMVFAFLSGNAVPLFAIMPIGFEQGWSTYYGGSAEDVVTDMIVTGEYVYICGYTNSDTGIASSGTPQSNKSDGYDGFVVKFDFSGKRIWGTYIGGPGDDYATSIAFEPGLQAVVIAGYTSSKEGIYFGNGYRNKFGGGEFDAFISIVDQNGKRNWGSYIGGERNDYAYDIKAYDGNKLIAGKTNSTERIADGDKQQKK